MNRTLRLPLLSAGLLWAAGMAFSSAAPGESPATAAPPPALANGRIVLEAGQSVGGRLLKTTAGDLIGVTLDKSCEANFKKTGDACIEWKPATPLPAGWWHGTVESNFRGSYANRDFGIQFMAGRNPSVIVAPNYAGWGKQQPVGFEFWLHSAAPAAAIRIQPTGDLWRWNNTWPVSRIVLEQKTPAALTPADAVTLELPVRPDGTVSLPPGLPAGNWSMTGESAKGGTAAIGDSQGRTIAVAYGPDRYKRVGPRTAYFYSDIPLQSVAIQPAALFGAVLLRHNMTMPYTPFATTTPLTVTTDSARTETARLELTGAGLAGNAPAFPLLPKGLKTAVLTSWDDGKPEDLRCAEILNTYGYHPSFFLNQNAPAMKFLDKLEALNVEIGSHCYTHPSLYAQPPQRCLDECAEMRRVLEKALGHPVISMGYPNGYSPACDVDGDYVLRAVKAAGYWSGRTTRTAQETVESTGDLCIMNTDGFFGNSRDLERVWRETRAKDGGVFYFWGHSWQIGKTDEQWKKFEDFVAQFARQPDAWYPSQGEFSLWLWARQNVRITVKDQRSDRMVVELRRPWLHPWLAAKCPLSLKVPDGVTKAVWQGREIPVAGGFVELPWADAEGSEPAPVRH